MRTQLKECLTQNKFKPFPKITKSKNYKSYITYTDVFCVCLWNFDDTDPEKDKGLFMTCSSHCEEWFRKKMSQNEKGSVFGRESPQKMEMSLVLYRLSDTYLFDNYNKYVIYLLNFRLDLSWLGLEKKFFFLFSVSCIYFNNQEFTFPFLNILSCVISNKECL